MGRVTDPSVLAQLEGKPLPGALGRGTFLPPVVDTAKIASTRGTEVRTAADIATLPYAGPQAAASLQKAQAEAVKAGIEANQAQQEANALPKDPKLALFIKDLGLDELLKTVREARKEIGTGRATGITGSIGRIIPGSKANDFKGSLNSIQGAVIMEKLQALKDASKTGASGMGALSEREGQRLADSIAALSTDLSDGKLLEGLRTIERHALSLQAVGAGENPDDPAVAKKYGLASANAGDKPPMVGTVDRSAPPPAGPSSQGPLVPSRDGGTTAADPLTMGVREAISKSIVNGATQEDLNAYADQVGIPRFDATKNIDFQRAHPDNRGFEVLTQPSTKPLTTTETIANALTDNPVGAGVAGSLDMLSQGAFDNMTDNPERVRAIQAGIAGLHPTANLVGQVGGAGLMGLGAEAAAAKMGAGPLASLVAGDVLPGMGYGAGSADNGDRVSGGALGGLAGLLGGFAGRGAGKLISGSANPALSRMAEQGVPFTPGRLMGPAMSRMEDRLAGMPLIGDVIAPQMQRMREGVNAAAFKQMSPDITDIGQAGVMQAKAAEAAAYRGALDGVNVVPDAQFGPDLVNAVHAGSAIPGLGADFNHIMQSRVAPIAGQSPTITGDQFQDMLRTLRKSKSGYQKMDASGINPMGGEVADALGNVEGALTGLMQRQAPEVMPALNAANIMHGQKEALKNAVLAAEARGGVFSPLELARAAIAGTKKFGGSDAAAVGNRPFNQLTQDAQSLVPSTVPDSGTAGRLVLPGALALLGGGSGFAGADEGQGAAGAGTGAVTGLGLGAALASPYLLRPILQKLLAGQRPEALVKTGNFLGATRLPGALALPLLAGGQ